MGKRSNKLSFPLILGFSHILVFVLGYFVFSFCSSFKDENKETLPTPPKQMISSPDASFSAGIFNANNGNFLDGDRFYLGIKKGSTTIINTRDLSEGFGTYESGIEEIIWIGNDKIRIARIISDKPDTLTYDIKNWKWNDLK